MMIVITLLATIVLSALAAGASIGFERGRKAGLITGLRMAATELDRMNLSAQEPTR